MMPDQHSLIDQSDAEEEYIPDLFSLRKSITHKNTNYWIERLITDLPLFIAKASASAHSRKKDFYLTNEQSRPRMGRLSGSETEWENGCYFRWHIRHGIKAPKAVRNGWHRIISRQVPFEPPLHYRDTLTADLIGISEDGFPVIIELKGHTKQSPLLAALLQALDYGIRMRESWFYFYKEWLDALGKYNWPTIQAQPDKIYLSCAAPRDYWAHELSPRFAPDLALLKNLINCLASAGFPISLVSLGRTTVNKVGSRVIASPVRLAIIKKPKESALEN